MGNRFVYEACPEMMNEWKWVRNAHRLPKKDKDPVHLCDLLLKYALILQARGENLEDEDRKDGVDGDRNDSQVQG